MSESGEEELESDESGRRHRGWVDVIVAGGPLAAIVVLGAQEMPIWNRLDVNSTSIDFLIAAGALVTVVGLVLAAAIIRDSARARFLEARARQRVRKAEENLGDVLRTSLTTTSTEHWRRMTDAHRLVSQDHTPVMDEEVSADARAFVKVADDRLTLAALWDVTHSRLDLYHEIVTGQAKRSFRSAQAAMWVGFLMLVGFAVLAAQAKTTTGAISIGSLGAVGAAFAAFIGRTFIRSQESAASHLRAYFDQPLELSRYLAAERLLADDSKLSSEQHAETFSALVQSIATAGHAIGISKLGKNGNN